MKKKKYKNTHNTNQYIKLISHSSLRPVEDYISDKIPINHQCLVCKAIRKTSPRSVKNNGGCRSCSKMNKHKESIGKFNIIIIGDTVEEENLYKCKKCNNLWFSSPKKVYDNKGCRVCKLKGISRREKYGSTYSKFIKNQGKFKVFGEYKYATTKMTHKCLLCDELWDVSPNKILGGRTCKTCNKMKSLKDVKMRLYYIYFPLYDAYKIGITETSVKVRFIQEKAEYIIIQEEVFDNGFRAWELEQKILRANKRYSYHKNGGPRFLKNGYTEVFYTDLIPLDRDL